MHPFQRLRPSNGSGTVSREMACNILGVGDAELTQLIRERAIPAPILGNAKTERFFMSELSAYVAARRAARAS